MKRFTILFLVLFFLMMTAQAQAVNRMYWATALTGGASGALDAIDGANLVDLDGAIVVTLTGSYLYSLDDDSAAAESSPDTISPDTNAGNKRWILVSNFIMSNTVGMGTATPAENLHIYENTANPVEIELENSEGAAGIGADGDYLSLYDGGVSIAAFIDQTTYYQTVIGSLDTIRGNLDLRGHATGTALGGSMSLEMSDDYDGVDNQWEIRVNNDDLEFVQNVSGEMAHFTHEGVFDVSGNITATNISASGDCCADFVFADNYGLKSLKQLAEEIEILGHLPGMTQGVGKEKKNLNIGKAIKELIVKVEEQALYILQLNNRIEELETNKK